VSKYRVYIAAASTAEEIARALHWRTELEEVGIEVVSTWTVVVGQTGAGNPREASTVDRGNWSRQDLSELIRADILWLLAPPAGMQTRGAWVELGYAYAESLLIVSSGDTRQSIFTALGSEYETDEDAFDGIRKGVLSDRSQFFKDLTMPFYGYNRPGAKVSEGVRESFWLQGMMAGMPASYFCIKAFSETDQTEDLKKIDKPTLILHGDDDQIVPIGASAMLSSKLVKGATLKVYKGAPHGMCTTQKDEVNADLLAFIKG